MKKGMDIICPWRAPVAFTGLIGLVFGWMCFFSACGKNESPGNILPAFYHWQTHLETTPTERALLDSLGAKKLYVKFFDVDWDETRQQPVPLAEVQIDTSLLYGLDIVPTVFITNRTFLNLKMSEVDRLAKRVSGKIIELVQGKSRPIEIQMDCDWTESTREKYFRFLEQLQADDSPFSILHSPLKISCTIRLHQIKYPDRTGVPPVDRGMLMAYNMGEVDEWETENSIFDLNILDAYLSNSQFPNYPIPMDLALSIFRWGVVFRGNLADENKWELAYLINDLGPEDLTDTTRFAQLTPTRYEVRKNTYLEGYYLYENDRVRLESVSPEVLEKAVALLLKTGSLNHPLSEQPPTVAFYHLDTSTLKVFDHEKLEKVLENF